VEIVRLSQQMCFSVTSLESLVICSKVVFVSENQLLALSVKGFICDAPARAFIKCIKSHSGYYGCEKCVDRGIQVNKKMTFQNLDATLRSDESFFASEARRAS